MKRPLTVLAITYAAGIIAAEYISFPIWAPFVFSFVTLTVAVSFGSIRPHALLALLFLTGWTNAVSRFSAVSPHDLRLHFSQKPELVSIRGTILEIPRGKSIESESEGLLGRSFLKIQTSAFRKNEIWEPSLGKIVVNTFGPLGSSFRKGQQIEVVGVLQPPQPPLADGLFDYKTYLRRQGIHFQLNTRNASDLRLISSTPATRSLPERFLAWAQNNLKRGLPEEDESLHLLYAMTLGWKSALDAETSQRFMRSGTMHIFAISGLHIALIAGIILALLRAVRMPRQWCGLVVVPLLWFYTMATGWQPSAVRSSIMMTIVIVGWSLKRPGDLLNSLGAAAFIILLWEPQQLFQASFQLSFFVVLTIALLMPTFEKLRQRVFKYDSFLPPELRPRWQRWLDVPIRFVTITFLTSSAAWLGSLPLAAKYFHLFTPVSLLANVAIVPLAALALMSNVGSLICGIFFPPLSEVFNHASWFFMTSMIWLSDKATAIPGAFFYVRSPSLLEIIAYYSLIFSIFTGWIFTSKHKRWVCGGLSAILLVCVLNFFAERNTYCITVLPLGGGESIFVDAPGLESDLLIDAGNESMANYIVTPFLHAQGKNRIPNLLLTHGDIRNIGGVANVIAEFLPNRVFTSPIRFRSSPYRMISQQLDSASGLRNEVAEGGTVAGWEIVYPRENEKFSQADDGPLVLKKTIHGVTFLFLSDLSRHGQNLFWERHQTLKADIVVSGLPRDSEPLNAALIESLQPRLIVITDAEFPATERASFKLRERLETCGVSVLFTRDTGSISFEVKPGSMRIRAMNEESISFEKLAIQALFE